MSGRRMTRAEFVQNLLRELKKGTEIAFYAPESVGNAQKSTKIRTNIQQKTVVLGHKVDIDWWYTLRYIRSLPETPER